MLWYNKCAIGNGFCFWLILHFRINGFPDIRGDCGTMR